MKTQIYFPCFCLFAERIEERMVVASIFTFYFALRNYTILPINIDRQGFVLILSVP